MPKNYTSFRATPALVRELASRGDGLGLTARRDIERYYHLLAEELKTVNLTESEAMLIVDTCNGTLFEPHTIRLLWAEIDDAIRLDRLDHKWQVDGPELVAKLRSLTAGQMFAVVDGCERFWADPNQEDQVRKVGLVR